MTVNLENGNHVSLYSKMILVAINLHTKQKTNSVKDIQFNSKHYFHFDNPYSVKYSVKQKNLNVSIPITLFDLRCIFFILKTTFFSKKSIQFLNSELIRNKQTEDCQYYHYYRRPIHHLYHHHSFLIFQVIQY